MIHLRRDATIAFSLTVITAALCIARVAAAAPPEPTLRMEPAQLEVSANEEFLVRVIIEDVENLGGFQVGVSFDPAVLEVRDAALGEFLPSSGRSVVPVGPQVSNEDGTVVLGAISIGEQPGSDGSGVLAILTCVARSTGSSALSLRDVQMLAPDASAISVEVEDGQVLVQGAEAEATEGAKPSPTSAAATLAVVPSPSPRAMATGSSSTGSPQAPTRSVRWGWIAAGLLLAAVGMGAMALGLRGRRPQA